MKASLIIPLLALALIPPGVHREEPASHPAGREARAESSPGAVRHPGDPAPTPEECGVPRKGRERTRQEIIRVIAMPEPTEDASAEDYLGLPVDASLWRQWKEARDRALSEGATVIIFEITTPGGAYLTARQFADDLKHLRERRGVRTVAYIPHAATSAGAILALACGEIVMGPDGQIGNVIPLEFRDFFSMKEAEGKVKTEVVATMRSLARESGWPPLLLEAMADKRLDIGALIDRVSGEVEIIADREYERRLAAGLDTETFRWNNFDQPDTAVKLSAEDVRYLKLPARFCETRGDLGRALGITQRSLLDEEIIELERPSASWFNPDFSFEGGWFFSALMLILGVTFTIMEFKTPGLGIFGVLGLLSFMGFFLLQSDSTSTIAITTSLLLLGFLLLLVELIIIPGFGVAGVAGIVLILGSLYVAGVKPEGDSLWEHLIPDTTEEWNRTRWFTIQLLGSAVLGAAGAIFIARNIEHLPFVNKTFLKPPILEGSGKRDAYVTPEAPSPHGPVTLRVGEIGTAETDLRPAGRVRFPEGPVDVVADGEWVERGTRVRVVLARGNRVVVAPLGEPEK